MENNIFIPIDTVEVRATGNSKGKYSIRGKAKLVPGKKYSYLFKTEKDGTPVASLKEVISEKGWEKIKKKILSKQVFIDENHKTVAELQINRRINDLARETGKDLNEYKQYFKKWMRVADIPLFKLNDAQLTNDAL